MFEMTGLDGQAGDAFAGAVSAGVLPLAPDPFALGLMYCAGREVRLDLVEAHKWFNIAALRGNAEARTYRAEIAREMSKDDVARAQRLAREWLSAH